MKDKHELILNLKGASRHIKKASKLMKKVYYFGWGTDPDLEELAKTLDSWAVETSKEIKKEIKKGVSR